MSAKERSNVVPFDRPAAYWLGRARHTKGQDQLVLLRKAAEKEDSLRANFELARAYADLQCLGAVERYVLRTLARDPLMGEAYFVLARAALAHDQEDLAVQALVLYLRIAPGGTHADRAQDILWNHPWHDDTRKRGARANILHGRALGAFRQGDTMRAVELANHALRCGGAPRGLTSVLLAQIYLSLKQPEEALQCLQNMADPTHAVYLTMGQCYGRMHKPELCEVYVTLGEVLCFTLDQCRMLCLVACEAGLAELAASRLELLMQDVPFSIEWLQLMAFCKAHMGDKAAAQALVKRVREIDPDDVWAGWCTEHPADKPPLQMVQPLDGLLTQLLQCIPPRLTPTPLNRLLHLLTISLHPYVDSKLIYSEVPPLWRALTASSKRHCDEGRDAVWQTAFSMFMLECAGYVEKSVELYLKSPHRGRVKRCLTRLYNIKLRQFEREPYEVH